MLKASLALAACGPSGVAEMPARLPWGPNPLDPRQPGKILLDPRAKIATLAQIQKQSGASPIHLSGSLVLRSGATGSIPEELLRNPMGQDMEILEIKFELSGGAIGGDSDPLPYGGTIWCELTMGGVKITNGAIPVWNFGRAENLDGEVKIDSTDNISFGSYSWRLPRPLFVPAGATVVPSFVHTGLIPDSINVRIGYSARTVFVQPKVVYMPWVAKFVSKAFNPIAAADVDLSSEKDLANANDEVLHLQRFVGRAFYQRANGTVASESAAPGFSSRYLMVRMTDSYGRPIVRNYTPFRSVFGSLTRSWEMDNGAELDPRAYYTVNLRKDAMAMAVAGGIGQVFISMVGWRELGGA